MGYNHETVVDRSYIKRMGQNKHHFYNKTQILASDDRRQMQVLSMPFSRICGQESRRYEESWDHTFVYFKPFCGCKFIFINILMLIPHFYPTDELPLTNESILLRIDLYTYLKPLKTQLAQVLFFL